MRQLLLCLLRSRWSVSLQLAKARWADILREPLDALHRQEQILDLSVVVFDAVFTSLRGETINHAEIERFVIDPVDGNAATDYALALDRTQLSQVVTQVFVRVVGEADRLAPFLGCAHPTHALVHGGGDDRFLIVIDLDLLLARSTMREQHTLGGGSADDRDWLRHLFLSRESSHCILCEESSLFAVIASGGP